MPKNKIETAIDNDNCEKKTHYIHRVDIKMFNFVRNYSSIKIHGLSFFNNRNRSRSKNFFLDNRTRLMVKRSLVRIKN